MSVGSDVLFLQRSYPVEQLWLPFVTAIYPKEVEVEEPKQSGVRRTNVGWSVTSDAQYTLDFKEGKVISKNHRKRLHKEKFPTFDRRPSGALLELAIKGEPQGRKLRGNRARETRKQAIDWCMMQLRGRFIPDRYFVFEHEDDYTLALMHGVYFTQIDNIIKVC